MTMRIYFFRLFANDVVTLQRCDVCRRFCAIFFVVAVVAEWLWRMLEVRVDSSAWVRSPSTADSLFFWFFRSCMPLYERMEWLVGIGSYQGHIQALIIPFHPQPISSSSSSSSAASPKVSLLLTSPRYSAFCSFDGVGLSSGRK